MNILLTGSSTGIGRALAERLLSRGHHVWGLARSDQSDFAALYPAFRHTRCDVSDYSAVAAATSAYAAAWPQQVWLKKEIQAARRKRNLSELYGDGIPVPVKCASIAHSKKRYWSFRKRRHKNSPCNAGGHTY